MNAQKQIPDSSEPKQFKSQRAVLLDIKLDKLQPLRCQQQWQLCTTRKRYADFHSDPPQDGCSTLFGSEKLMGRHHYSSSDEGLNTTVRSPRSPFRESIECEFQSLRKETLDLKASCARLSTQNTELRRELQYKQRDYRNQEQQIVRLNRELQEKEHRITQIRIDTSRQCGLHIAQKTAVYSRVQALQAQLEKLRHQAQTNFAKQLEIERLRQDIQKAHLANRIQLGLTESKCKKYGSVIVSLVGALKQLRSELIHIRNTVKVHFVKSQQETQIAISQIQLEKQDLQRLVRQSKQSQTVRLSLEQTLRNKESGLQKLINQLDQMQADRKALRQNLEKSQNQTSQLKVLVAQLRGERNWLVQSQKDVRKMNLVSN